MNKSFLRNAIGEYMVHLGNQDERVVMVNADLSGTCRNQHFARLFPERSFNMGIAEQNMVSFAVGLSCEGFIPYVFSMAPFITMRACEQVRTDVAYGKRNVKMIGVYAGVSGGISGATHWGIEDCGIITSIPGIAVFEVSDANQARRLMDFSLHYKEPMYIRCGVEPTMDIYDERFEIIPGGSKTIVQGDDGAFLCSGVVVQYAIEAAKAVYEKTGKKVRVVDMYSIKPIDEAAIISAADTGSIIVAQDHNIIGGLGSAVANVIAYNNVKVAFKVLGIRDEFVPMAHAPYLYSKFKLDACGLSDEMITLMSNE